MKILIVHNRYRFNNIGGEEAVYENELQSLQQKLGKENVLCYEVSNDDIKLFNLLLNIWFSVKHYKNVKQIVKQNKIDIVHVHNFFPLLTPSVFKAGKDGGAKVIHTLHNYRFWCIAGTLYLAQFGICHKCAYKRFALAGIWHRCYRRSLWQSLAAQLAFSFYKSMKIFNQIDYFFALSPFTQQKMRSLGIDKDRIILKSNGIRKTNTFSTVKQGYIYVGRLEEAKGIYQLLTIWQRLGEKFILTIIGTSTWQTKLERCFSQKNIIFKGKCSREETIKQIASSKYLIQPSLLYETFGLTMIEAMRAGVPVIGFDIGTRLDFIKDGKNGFLSNTGDLQSVIIKSFDYNHYDKLSKNAIATADLYDNDKITGEQISIYHKIINQ